MARLPALITARDLLVQVVDSLKLKPEESRLEKPCDCEYMALLSDANTQYPLHLVNGGDYLNWVRRYGYYSCLSQRKTVFLCSESRPLSTMLSLLSLASGIPQGDLLSLRVCRTQFEALNRALENLYLANPGFCEFSPIDFSELLALIRRMKKHVGVETVAIDALHHVRFDVEGQATNAEQSLITRLIQSTAHMAKLTIVAGFYDPEVEFPDLHGDTIFHCGPGNQKTSNQKPVTKSIVHSAMAAMLRLWPLCSSFSRRIT